MTNSLTIGKLIEHLNRMDPEAVCSYVDVQAKIDGMDLLLRVGEVPPRLLAPVSEPEWAPGMPMPPGPQSTGAPPPDYDRGGTPDWSPPISGSVIAPEPTDPTANDLVSRFKGIQPSQLR